MILNAKATARFNSSVFTRVSDTKAVCSTDAWSVTVNKENGFFTALICSADTTPEGHYSGDCLVCGIGYTSYECARDLYKGIVAALSHTSVAQARILGEVISLIFK